MMRTEAMTRLARSGVHAQCQTCGESAPDWRRLLGVGAAVVACNTEGRRVIVSLPDACRHCGGSELVVTTPRDSSRSAGPGSIALLGRFIEEGRDGEKRLIPSA